MEWVGVIVLLLVLGLALPVAAGALTSPALGLQLPLAGGAFVFGVLYIITGEEWMTWVTAALALGAMLAVGAGLPALLSDEKRAATPGQGPEEVAALSAGALLPMLGVVVFAMILAGVGVTTV